VAGQSKSAKIMSGLAVLAAGCLAARAQSDVPAAATSQPASSVAGYSALVTSTGAGHEGQIFFNRGGGNGARTAAGAPGGFRPGGNHPDNKGLSQGLYAHGGLLEALDAPLGTVNLLRTGFDAGNSVADSFLPDDFSQFANGGGVDGPITLEASFDLTAYKDGDNLVGGPTGDDLLGFHAAKDELITDWSQDGGAHTLINDTLPMSDTHPDGMYGYHFQASQPDNEHPLALTVGAPPTSASAPDDKAMVGEISGIKLTGNDDDNMSVHAPSPLVLSPEPSSIALACLGAVTLLIRRRK